MSFIASRSLAGRRFAAALAAGVLGFAGLTGCSASDAPSSSSGSSSGAAGVSATGEVSAATPGPVAEPVNSGALVGNQQRSWPDPEGKFDDSHHTTPGEYSEDMFHGRPVWIPVNHDGDYIDAAQLKKGSCRATDLQGSTQQQYVNARYMVLNSEAGPSEAVRGIPQGYAKSPQGAVVSAMNAAMFSYIGGDEIAKESFEQLWQYSETAKRAVGDSYDSSEKFASTRTITYAAPVAYKVLDCTGSRVVVDVAVSMTAPHEENDYLVFRLPMEWKQGDWRVVTTEADEPMLVNVYPDLDGFTEVTYS